MIVDVCSPRYEVCSFGNEEKEMKRFFVPTETQSSKPTFLSFFSFFHGIDGPIILLWGYISSGCPIADEPIFEKKRGAGHVGRNELPEHY